jgi:hypothetical protein
MASGKRGIIFVLCMAVCLIPALICADQQTDSTDPKAVLGALAEEYWTKRLIEKDYQFTYEKELEKDALSFSEYVEKAKDAERFTFKSVKTARVEITGDRGAVFLTVECITPFMPKGYTQMLQDLWLFRSGQWVHKFSDK